MTQATESAEDTIRVHSPEVAEQIKKAALDAIGNEAQFRGNLARGRVLEGFAEGLGLTLQPREEYTLINGRADAVYNRFVIEYEPPGRLTPRDSQKNRQAVGQVKQYIEDLVKVERHKPERLAGVATDGFFFIFCRFRGGVWHADDPLPVAADSTGRFLASLYLLSTEKALTADNLVRDFGENTNVARLAVSSLYKALAESPSPKVTVIYGQWRQQFSEVCGYEEGSPRLDVRAVARQYGVQDPKPNAFRLFFSIHTYYATFIKLLALQVVHYYVAPKLGTALPQVASYPSDRLQKYLKDMERGGIFKQLGISNFLEGDFFGWYLEVWDEPVDKGIRRIVSELANYSLVTLDADPDETRDLLKKLYQNVMPRQLRHDLGEYYTPDWLAERLLNQVGFTSEREPRLQEKRLLDPACGSGTFLVLAIKRVKEHCAERPIRSADVLSKILSNIQGFDLNPLAIISARTNYLLALGDLLQAQRDFDVNIPVYLCDSILTPSQAGQDMVEPEEAKKPEKGQKQVRMVGAEERLYRFKTVVGEFAIPGSLVKAQYIDQLAGLVEECVDSKYAVSEFRKRLLQAFPLVEGKDAHDIQALEQLYARIRELDERAINGIWARIIKNAFAPLFCGHFDYVAGNPPWVNWESLPDDYRNDTKRLWVYHGLFPHGGMDTILGKGKKDISMLMTYSAMHDYLHPSGKLGFVITQSVFKTSGAGQGFRRFVLGDGTRLQVLAVDDMTKLQPFEGASNRTSIVVLEKGRPTRYPVSYNFWWKKVKGIGIGTDFSFRQVLDVATYRKFEAEPIDAADPTSAWLTGKPKALAAVRKVLGKSDYGAHEGVNTGGANGVYWVNVVGHTPQGLAMVSNLTEGARTKVESVQAAIEPDLIYPLLRGRDVRRWAATPSAHIIMVQDPELRRGIPEDDMKLHYPKAYAYLKRFDEVLWARKDRGSRGLMEKGAPFYSMFGVSEHTLAEYKVVWREVGEEADAAVAESDGKVAMPDHTLVAVSCGGRQEAHYVCGMVNSSPFRFASKNCIVLHPDPHILEHVRVPKFKAGDKIHRELVALSQQAHQAAAEGDQETVAAIERRIDQLAADLWGLTNDELKEIQESLAELKA
ncbi:MAG: N-6 DNA methylase [Chloroflexi bacterium]|nr:N-6 DNA methylase [Chloroflexota bacterium]